MILGGCRGETAGYVVSAPRRASRILGPPLCALRRGRTLHREGNNVYVVKEGDTLWAISRKFGMSIKDLTSLNSDQLSLHHPLVVGQVIQVPHGKHAAGCGAGGESLS